MARVSMAGDERIPAWALLKTHRTVPKKPMTPQSILSLKNLWIIGAGGHGRDIYSMSHSARGNGLEWHVAGFLNDIADALEGFSGYPSIGGDTEYLPGEDDRFICAIGDINGRKKVCEKFQARGARFINMIQESAALSPCARLGAGIVMEAFSGVGADACVDDFTTILFHAMVAHDATVGRFCQLSPFAAVLGHAKLGDEVAVGAHAVVLPRVKVGARATIGPGSVVTEDVPEGATVAGTPATVVKAVPALRNQGRN